MSIPNYTIPVVADFTGEGDFEVLLARGVHWIALVDADGSPIWHRYSYGRQRGQVFASAQGIGDFLGDGSTDVLSANHCDTQVPDRFKSLDLTDFQDAGELRLLDGMTGEIIWGLELKPACDGSIWPPGATSMASADIDGDGRDEAIFAVGDTVYSVGDDGSGLHGRIEWTMMVKGTSFGNPVIADAIGDGNPEIILVDQTGLIYVLR
jgi:hypothetical protein